MTTNPSPRVSICLPVFNGQDFLPAAIESVLVQTFADFELVIVDDCSTDRSAQIIHEYAGRDKRIRSWTSSEKAGLFGNYNRCMEMACGEYIKPFAQDDLLHSDMLRRLVGVLDANPELALASTARAPICGQGMRIASRTPQVTAASYFRSSSSVSGREIIKRSINPVVNFIGEPTTVMFRREHIGSGFDPQFHHLGDLEYWFRILLNGRYLFLDDELCSYRMHTGSTSTTNHKYLLYAADLLKLGRRYKRFIWEAGITQAEFNDNVIRRAALDVTERGESFRSSLLNIDPDYFSQFDDYVSKEPLPSLPAGLLELALQSLLRVSEAGAQPSGRCFHSRGSIIESLEHNLQTYLSSASWRVTKFLRELNKTLLDREVDESTIFDSRSEMDYERYLRKQIWRVKHSRSWRLTTPLRVANNCFDFCMRHLRPLTEIRPNTLGAAQRLIIVARKNLRLEKSVRPAYRADGRARSGGKSGTETSIRPAFLAGGRDLSHENLGTEKSIRPAFLARGRDLAHAKFGTDITRRPRF